MAYHHHPTWLSLSLPVGVAAFISCLISSRPVADSRAPWSQRSAAPRTVTGDTQIQQIHHTSASIAKLLLGDPFVAAGGSSRATKDPRYASALLQQNSQTESYTTYRLSKDIVSPLPQQRLRVKLQSVGITRVESGWSNDFFSPLEI